MSYIYVGSPLKVSKTLNTWPAMENTPNTRSASLGVSCRVVSITYQMKNTIETSAMDTKNTKI